MRSLGLASRALELALIRATDPNKKTFGKVLYEHGTVVKDLSDSRIELDQARLLVLGAAIMIDLHPQRAKGAMKEIGMSKVRAVLCSAPICSNQHADLARARANRLSFLPSLARSLIVRCNFTVLRVSAVSLSLPKAQTRLTR